MPCNHKELLSGEHNTKGVEVVFQDRGSGKRRVEVRSMIKGIQNRNSKSIAWYWNAYWDADILYIGDQYQSRHLIKYRVKPKL